MPRLNIELSVEAFAKLERLREKVGSTVNVFRSALAVYELLLDESAKGGTVFVRHADGTEREVLLV